MLGDPTTIVPDVAREVGASEIHFHVEPGTYENETVEKIVEHFVVASSSSDRATVRLVGRSGYTLYHPNDLPFDPDEWSLLAHPKNKITKRGRKPTKKENSNSTSNESSDRSRSGGGGGSDVDLVDVSADRWTGVCRVMGDFRRAARRAAAVRRPLRAPTRLDRPKRRAGALDVGSIPTLEDLFRRTMRSDRGLLGLDKELTDLVLRNAMDRRDANANANANATNRRRSRIVDEASALDRTEAFVTRGRAAVADRAKADVSNDDSSRLSVHLALGTLSPRTLYWNAFETGKGCEWITSHLEMRDFFLFAAYANDRRLFRQEGTPLRGSNNKTRRKNVVVVQWKNPRDEHRVWERWATGRTRLPLVDAAMTELASTGYCSNRARQNVASVLTKDLNIDWRAGAELFQFLLEDHCVGANWGNWLYFSGVGPDPKNRHFRTVSQALRYDPDGSYVKKWLPTLDGVDDPEALFRPFDFNVPGYESPVVNPSSQLTWQDSKRLEETNKLIP